VSNFIFQNACVGRIFGSFRNAEHHRLGTRAGRAYCFGQFVLGTNTVRGQSGGCKRSSWTGWFLVTWWSTDRRCMREIFGFFLTCAVALVCPWYKNYSQTALMCQDRETLLVPGLSSVSDCW
jgi:hypothetical protein